jgi:hypothetical protein
MHYTVRSHSVDLHGLSIVEEGGIGADLQKHSQLVALQSRGLQTIAQVRGEHTSRNHVVGQHRGQDRASIGRVRREKIHHARSQLGKGVVGRGDDRDAVGV